jgi:thiol-disulfide isomerase/thioredoxin
MRRAVLAAVLTLVASLTGACTDLTGTEGKEWITGEGRIIEVPIEERAAPVTASGVDLDGNALDLEDYRGRVVVLNVWASWCPPCRAEMPLVVELANSYDEADVAFVGVDIRETGGQASAQSFVRSQGMPFPSFYDPGSEVLLRLSDDLGPYSLPSTVVLDREGRLAALILGEIPGAISMTDVIDDVAAESADG